MIMNAWMFYPAQHTCLIDIIYNLLWILFYTRICRVSEDALLVNTFHAYYLLIWSVGQFVCLTPVCVSEGLLWGPSNFLRLTCWVVNFA